MIFVKKIWFFIKDYAVEHPESAIAKVLDIGRGNNIAYLKYYNRLESEYVNPETCKRTIENHYHESFKRKMHLAYDNDVDSKLGTYYRVNPMLQSYVPTPQSIIEIERELITRFRTGSHSLAIELGRYSNIPRINRLCACGNSVQTVWHIFSECQLTREIVNQNYENLNEIFADANIHQKLFLVCTKLKIPI